jgi:hypothetical protein
MTSQPLRSPCRRCTIVAAAKILRRRRRLETRQTFDKNPNRNPPRSRANTANQSTRYQASLRTSLIRRPRCRYHVTCIFMRRAHRRVAGDFGKQSLNERYRVSPAVWRGSFTAGDNSRGSRIQISDSVCLLQSIGPLLRHPR